MGFFKKTSEYRKNLDHSKDEKENLDEQHDKIRKDSDFIRSLKVELKSNSRLDEESIAKIESAVSDAEDDTDEAEANVSGETERIRSEVSQEKKEVNDFHKNLRDHVKSIDEINKQLVFKIATEESDQKDDEIDELIREMDDFER